MKYHMLLLLLLVFLSGCYDETIILLDTTNGTAYNDTFVNVNGDTMIGELDLPSLDFTAEINIKRNQTSLIYTDLNTNSIRLNFPIPQASFGSSNYIYPNTQYCYQFGRNHYCGSSDSLQAGQSHYGAGTYNAQFGYQNLINSTGSINGVLQAGLNNAYKSGLYGVQAGSLNTGGGFSTIQLGFNNLGPTGFFGYYQIGANNEFGSNSGGAGTVGSANYINTQNSYIIGQNNRISGFTGGTYGLGTQVYTQGGNDYFLGEYLNITANKIIAIGFGGTTTSRIQLNETNAIYLVSKETTTSPSVISAKINGTVSKFETNIYTTKNITVDGDTRLYGDIHDDRGWIEYIDEIYNTTNRLTIGTTLVNFSMVNYTTRQQELPYGITNLTWFNGTHLKTDKAGNTFLYRFRYKAEPQGANAYCEFFYDIGGSVGQLPGRLITFPKGLGVEQIGQFTNIEYTLNTWYTNGAVPQIQCSTDVEFWDIELAIEKTYTGKGVY